MKHHKHDKLARYNVSDQKLILSALTGAVLLGSALFAGVTIAADTDKSNQQRETAAAQQEKFKEGAPLQHERLKTLVKASKFAGNIDIHDSQNKKIGKVKDAVVDLSNGHIEYVIVSLGSTMGMGGKLVAMPPEAFRVFRNNDEVKLDVTEQQVKQAPAISDDKQVAMLDSNAMSGMYQALGLKMTKQNVSSSATLGKLTDIMKSNVSTSNKEKANVKDVALDLNDGYAPYVIVGIGGIAGINEKLVAVPVNAFSLSNDKKTLHVSLSEAQLKNTPPIDNGRWDKTLADRETGKNIYGAFGLNPYWGTSAEVGGVTEPSAEPIKQPR